MRRGHHKHMTEHQGCSVEERDHVVIAMNDLRRELAVSDLAKDARCRHEGPYRSAAAFVRKIASRNTRRTSEAPVRLGSICRVNHDGSPDRKCA